MKKETSDTLHQIVLFTDELHYYRNKVLQVRNVVPLISDPTCVLLPDFRCRGVMIKQSPWITLAILSSIGLISMHAETMLLPTIPDIIRDFHINYSTSSWILTAYLISGAVMTPIAGKLSDIYGKKKILLIIMTTYTIGVILGGLAFSFSFLLIARTIQGVGFSVFPIHLWSSVAQITYSFVLYLSVYIFIATNMLYNDAFMTNSLVML